MPALTILRALWVAGGLSLVLCLVRDSVVVSRRPEKLAGTTQPWISGTFQADRPYPSTTRGVLPVGVATVGSWVGGDKWVGNCATVSMPVDGRAVRVCVAGYPQHPGCRLWVEFRHSDGHITQKDCSISDPRETWNPWDFQPPVGAVALRIVAEDFATDGGGWLALSEPILRPASKLASVFMFAQVLTTLAFAMVLVWGPGIMWAPRSAPPARRAGYVLAVGPLCLAGIGLITWAAGGRNVWEGTGVTLVVLFWAGLGISLWQRHGGEVEIPTGLSSALALSALLALAGVAKASFSGGPEGELFGGSIYRTLAVGDRSDSRVPFHVVQAASRHFGPASPETERYFAPWTFFSRGPLAGLVALPIVLATAGKPPADIEPRAWQPFDPTGFASYRIALIVLASTLVVAVFAALVPFTSEKWAIAGAGLLALSPFGVHETIFTWPKSVATVWVLLSFVLVHGRMASIAGIALGIGYLFHPMTALWAPWLALWVAISAARGGTSAWEWVRAGVTFSLAFCALVLPWIIAGNLASHQPESSRAGQLGFVEYFRLAEYEKHPSWQTWAKTRWMNLSNTFLPFWLFLVNRDHAALNSVYGASGPVEKFAFGWWNTLPLGAGLLLWGSTVVLIASTLRRFWRPTLLLLLCPSLLLTAYWGASSTGLMRECGHPLFAAFAGLAVVAAASKTTARAARVLAHPVFPWLQLPETLLMLWLTTVVNQFPPGADCDLLNPLYALINVLSLAAMAAVLTKCRFQLAGHPTVSV